MPSAEDPDREIAGLLRSLSVSAARSNLVRCAVLEAALDAIERGTWTSERAADAVEAAHQIVGSAGTFGFHRASELAASLETYFGVAPAESSGVDLSQARGFLADLRTALAAGSACHQDDEE